MTTNKQIILTSFLLIFFIIFFGTTNIDIVVQDNFFNSSINTWILDRDLQPYKFIFYDGIKKVLILFALLFLFALVFFKKNKTIQEYKKGILVIVLSAILVPIISGGLKKVRICPVLKMRYIMVAK